MKRRGKFWWSFRGINWMKQNMMLFVQVQFGCLHYDLHLLREWYRTFSHCVMNRELRYSKLSRNMTGLSESNISGVLVTFGSKSSSGRLGLSENGCFSNGGPKLAMEQPILWWTEENKRIEELIRRNRCLCFGNMLWIKRTGN